MDEQKALLLGASGSMDHKPELYHAPERGFWLRYYCHNTPESSLDKDAVFRYPGDKDVHINGLLGLLPGRGQAGAMETAKWLEKV